MMSQKNRNTKIWINLPQTFLEQFDIATQTTYTSRNEAIRHAMNLITEKTKENNQHPNKKEKTEGHK